MDGNFPHIVTYTIFFNPLDYPGRFVLRRFLSSKAGVFPDPEPMIVCGSLEEARAALPCGVTNLGRMPADEPQIVETWLL